MNDSAQTEGADNATKVKLPPDAAAGGRLSTAERVRQGHTGDHVRWILLVSFAGAALILLLAYLLFVT